MKMKMSRELSHFTMTPKANMISVYSYLILSR
jgi:hypothetical protein